MAIFKRYKIDRYKEVMINQPDGLVSDGGLSTYTLDQTSDFLGIIKDISLIGEVVEITMDTGGFSVNQINNTTQSEFDQLVSNGTIRITERILGWTSLSKTRASFYYQECSPTTFVRKQPISEHYYDFSTFGFGTSLVAGSSPQDTDSQYSVGESALRPVGSFDPNIGNNMGVFGPRFNQMDLQTYMRMVINSSILTGNGFLQNQQGETRSVNGWLPLDGQILSQIQLYLADKDEHFNNSNAQVISIGKYGRNRDTIIEGFRASSYIDLDLSRSIGSCLETILPSITINVTTVSPQTDEEIDILSDKQTPQQFTDMISNTIKKVLLVDPTFKFKSLSVDNFDNSPLVFFTSDLWPEYLQYCLMTDELLRNAFNNSESIKKIERIQKILDDIISKRLSGNGVLTNQNSQNFQ